MKDFKMIEAKAMELLKEDKGVFISVAHTDKNFQYFIAEQILKNKIDYLFIELSDGYIKKNIEMVQKSMYEVESLGKRKFTIQEKLKLFDMNAKSQPMLYVILCAYFLHKIKIQGIDIEEGKERDNLEKIFYSTEKSEPSVIKKAMEDRLSHDQKMADYIQKREEKGSHYLVLAGPMHGSIAKTLKIKNISVFERNQYLQSRTLISSIDYLKNIEENHPEIWPDFIFLYDGQGLAILYNNLGFFSPSKYANKDNPFGPYADSYCLPHDPIVQMGLKSS